MKIHKGESAWLQGAILGLVSLIMVGCSGFQTAVPAEMAYWNGLEPVEHSWKDERYSDLKVGGVANAQPDIMLMSVPEELKNKHPLALFIDESVDIVNRHLADYDNVIDIAEIQLTDTIIVDSDFGEGVVHEAEELQAYETPIVHFGDPTGISWRYETLSGSRLDEAGESYFQNSLLVHQGSGNWFKYYTSRVKPNGVNNFLVLQLGLIEVTAIWNKEQKQFVHPLSEHVALDATKKSSTEWPITVLALKGLVLNERGEVIRASVAGVVPFYPIDNYVVVDFSLEKIWFGHQSAHSHTDVKYIGKPSDYDWKTPLSQLINDLK